MKTLQFTTDQKKNKVTVECADGIVSVYTRCSYCSHCRGVKVGNRVIVAPQLHAISDIRKGAASDDSLMNAAMMFNTMVRDGSAVECDDDANKGFHSLY